MGSLDSESLRVPGKHFKATGLEESVHAFLSAAGALDLHKEPGCFLDVFEKIPLFPPLT